MMDSQPRPVPLGNASLTPAVEEWTRAALACRDRLSALHAPTEAAMLGLGDRLRTAYDTSRSLAAMARALDHRLSEPEFQAMLRDLDGTVQLVRRLRAAKSIQQEPLRVIADLAAALRRALGGLLQTMNHVNVLGINGKIEAAHMTVSGVDFSLFTHEIMRLADRGRATVEQAQRELAALEAAVGQAQALQSGFEQIHARNLNEVGDRLGGSLAAMRERERQAQVSLDRLPKVLEQATDRIGSVVSGLQFGDISRQRLEHVEQALAVLAEVAEGSQPLPPAAGDLDTFVAAVSELQIRQLSDIAQEFTSQSRTMLSGLGELVTAIDDIRQHTEAVYSSGSDGGSTFLMQVDQELQTVATAIDHYGEATRQTHQSLDDVRAAASGMAEAMRAIADVDTDMNLIGLNASIKCGNLGSGGRSLNVVAQELRAYARQTRTLAASVAELLGRVGTAADAVVASVSDTGGGDLGDLKANLDDVVGRLHQSGGETAWVLSRIQEQAAAVAAAVRDGVAGFDAHTTYQEVLSGTADALAQVAAAAAHGLDRGRLDGVKHSLVAFMQSHYTMETERDVHFGRSTQAPAANAEPDLSDILF